MKQIERYILRRMVTLTFWSLIAATMLVLTTQVLLRLNVLTTTGAAFTVFLKVSAYLVPSVMTIVMPFALLIGVAQILWSLNSDSELVVMEAAGAGPRTIFRPVLILAASMSVLVVLVGNIVEPRAKSKLYDLLAATSADLFSVAVRSGSFQKLEDGLYVQINEMLPGGEFGGIFLSDTRAADKELVYFAERGSIQEFGADRLLVLIDGQAQQRTPGSNKVSVVTFTSYALDLAAFLPTSGTKIRHPRTQSTAFLLNPDPEDFYARELPWMVKEELVMRLTSWMYPLLFGLAAFVFLGKAHSHREEHLFNVGLMAMTALGLRGFGFYSTNAAAQSAFMEVVAYGLPLLMIAVFFWLAITGRGLSAPKAWIRLNTTILEKLFSGYQRFADWRASRTRPGAGRA